MSTSPTAAQVQLNDIERRLTPQGKTIFSHLRRAGSITNVEAHAVHRVRSVSRRITEIADAIAQARSVNGAKYRLSKVTKKDATGQRYVRYYLRFGV